MTDYLQLARERAAGAPPADASNPYMDIARERQGARESQLRAVVERALKDDPELAAERQRLSQTSGLPLSVVERNLDEVRRKEAARALDIQRMMRDSPILARQLLDPSFTTIAQDDIGVLGQVERSFKDFGVSALKGAVAFPQAAVGVVDIFALGRFGKALESIGYRPSETQKILEGFYSESTQRQRGEVASAEGFWNTLDAIARNPQALATTVVESLPQMLGGAAVARGIGAVAPGLSPLFTAAAGEGVMAAGASASQIRDLTANRELTVGQAAAALGSGVGTAALGVVGGRLAQRMGLGDIDTALASGTLTGTPKAGFAKQVLGQGISEGLFEELPQSAQEQMWQNFALDRPLLEGVGNAAATGFAAGLATGGTFGATSAGLARMYGRALQDAENADRALMSGQALERAFELASQSALRERSPEQFRNLMNQMSGDAKVYVDGEVLNQLPPEALAVLPAEVRDKIAVAAATGDTVEISVADALTAAPGTPLAAALTQHARTSPDAPSAFEAQAAGEQAQVFLQQEAERVIQQAQDQAAARASQEAVKANIKAQLQATGRFRDAVNDGYATWASAFYTAYGSRMGMTAEQFFQRYPLRILGAAPGQQTGVLNAPGEMALRTVNAGDTVDGRVVREGVANMESIASSLDNYEVLPGVREVPMSAFDPEYVGSIRMERLDERTRRLAEEIRQSGEISPLIVVQDAEGMYVLEGGHRFDALIASGAKSLPAIVVTDLDNPPAPGQVFNQSFDAQATQLAADITATGSTVQDVMQVDQLIASNDIRTITLQDLVGLSIFPTIADRTAAAALYTGIDSSRLDVAVPLLGGPFFPLRESNVQAGVAWANRGKGVVAQKAAKLKQGANYMMVLMGDANMHQSNSTVAAAFMGTLEAWARDGRISPENVQKLGDLVREIGGNAADDARERLALAEQDMAQAVDEKALDKAKKARSVAQKAVAINSYLEGFPGFADSARMHAYVDGISFDARKRVLEIMASKEALALGAPPMQKILDATREPSLAGHRWGDGVLLIEVDQTNPQVELGAEGTGTMQHPDYPLGVRGRVVGKLNAPINWELLWQDWLRENADKDGPRRAFELAKPIVTVTQELVDRIGPIEQSNIDGARQARLAADFAAGNWRTSDNAVNKGGVSPQAFIDALMMSDAKDTLTKYTLADIKAGIKAGTKKIYQLGDGQIFFLLETREDGTKYLASVVNNERGARGIGAPAVVLKALEEGATDLDCFAVKNAKYPDGFLPALYGAFGFEVSQRYTFNPQYFQEQLPENERRLALADAVEYWKTSTPGFDPKAGMPDAVVMVWKGTDNDRREITQRYLRSGIEGLLSGGTRADVDAFVAESRAPDSAEAGQAAPADGGRAAGDQRAGAGASVASRARGTVQAVAELSDNELANLNLTADDRAAVRRALGLPDYELTQPAQGGLLEQADRRTASDILADFENARLIPDSAVLATLGEFPQYLQAVADFMVEQRQKLVDGRMTVRDIAKAYFITIASMGSDAIGVQTLQNKTGLQIDPMFINDGKVRPEEAAAAWLLSPDGKAALDALEAGQFDAELWDRGAGIRRAYGDDRFATFRAFDSSAKGYNFLRLQELTDKVNALAKAGDFKGVGEEVNKLNGIGQGKIGFIKHMLGMGDAPTIDAVEINFWLTGQGEIGQLKTEKAALAREIKAVSSDKRVSKALFDRISNRFNGLHDQVAGGSISRDVFQHIMHHWLWDRAKGIETTHEGMYDALRYAQGPRGTFNPQTLELVLNPNADLSTFFHETGHFFLEVMADIASQPGAPAQITEDMNAFLKWAGVPDLATWNKYSLDQKRPYHERWAESIEQYVMEGKAPSAELAPVMRRFRAWLVSVYQSIKQFLAARGVAPAGGQTLGQAAFHGTPYRGIEKFSTDKIGTGEGSQSFGWGLYFASLQDIAEYYRRSLVGNDGIVQDTAGAVDAISDALAGSGWDVSFVESDARYVLRDRKGREVTPDEAPKRVRKVADEALAPFVNRGQVYKVEIPEDSEMLDWDKPFDQQPAAVRKALAGMRKPTTFDDITRGRSVEQLLAWVDVFDRSNTFREWVEQDAPNITADELRAILREAYSDQDMGSYLTANAFEGYRTGESIYKELTTKLRGINDEIISASDAPKHASLALAAAGIKGIKYLDGGSRSAGDGTYNYVVFSGDDVAITNQFYQGDQLAGAGMQLNDDIRRVMDRMLATDEQIAQANEIAGLMPDEQADGEAAERLQKRSIADLKWAVKARDKVIAKLKREAKTIEKTIRAEVTTEIDQRPEVLAKAAIEKAEKEFEADPVSADMNIAAIADAFGYPSVEAMYRAIDAFGDKQQAIDGLVERRMLEEHGDLIDERAITEAANEAVHNEARARSLATELRTQQEMLGARADTGQTNARGARMTVSVLVEAAKQFGANVIARTSLKDLRATAWKHTAAERRAGKRWQEATMTGDTAAAVKAKQDQVLNNAAAKAALDAAAEAKKILEFFARVTKGNDEKVVEKGRDPDIVNAARAVLAAYGIETPASKGAAAYLERVKQNDPDTWTALEPMIVAATQNAQPLEALTFEELQGLEEAVQAMWFLAKRSRQMEVDGNLLDIDDAAQELFARMEQIGIPDRVPGEGMAVTEEEERGLFLKQGIAFLRRVEQWAEGMDGKYGGPFLRLVFQPIKDAADRYRKERIDYRKKFQALIKQIPPIAGDAVIEAPELGYTFGTPGSTAGTAMNEILHAIAHTGNDSNKRKLLLGRGWATELPDGTLDTTQWDAFINRLVVEGKLVQGHYDFVQGVWDLLEDTKPLAQKAHRDAFGRYFSEVTANEFIDPFGVMRRGGYVPAQVDSRLVKDNVLRKMAEEQNNSMAYAFPQPAKGFTISRVEYNQPLMLDLRSLSQHLDKVLLFSHMTNPARDVRKLLTRKTVSQPLDRIQPAALESMLQPWLQRSAQQIVETPIVGSGRWARIPGIIRARAGMALMFGNVSNAVQQITGLMTAAVRVKPSFLMRSLAQYVSNPRQFSREVWAASPYMDDRAKNEVAVLNEQMQAILLNPSTFERVQDWSSRHAYFLQTALDNVLSPIVWAGAYNQALTDGMSDKDAVRFADSTVRQTQGSTLPEDVSRFETGPAYARVFTQFVGYFNMMANTNATALKQVVGEVGLKKGAGKALWITMMGLMAPIWVAEAIALAFRGGPEDEDDDGWLDDWLAEVFGMGTVKGLLAQIPIAGQFGVAAVQRFNDNPLDDRISLSPAVSLMESSVGAPQSVYKAIVEEGSAQKAIRDVATLVSVATGVPVYGVARPIGYAAGVAQGRIEPEGLVDAVRGLITGTASPESRVP